MNRIRLAFGFLLLTLFLAAQLVSEETCPPLTVPQVIPGRDIFNGQQEMWLGEAQAVGIDQSISVIPDATLTAYLQGIVDRLAKNLPSGHVQFLVKLIDLPNAEAFSIAGGRIYISRKIVAVTKNEDEIAGILAHEMGHITAHHAAIQTSEDFRKVLHVTQVTDQDDVTAKWNQFLSNYRRQNASMGTYEKAVEIEEREQVQADTVALYLAARGGYSTQAFTEVFDRIADTKGKTGSFWTDLFQTTKPDSKRLRQIIKNTPSMPQACQMTRTDTAAQFGKWRSSVIEYSSASLGHEESLPGLISKRVLTERLRPEIQHIRISPDGRYVLAQDDSNVFVLERQPLKPLFHFGAADATGAQFTPDSRSIVLLFDPKGAPRVERWDVVTQKRTEVHEIYVKGGCLRSKIAPDGKTLACLTMETEAGLIKFDLDLFEVAAGTSFFHKKGWVTFDIARLYMFREFEVFNPGQKLLENIVPMAFSPDGRYFVVHSDQNTMAMDLLSRSPIEIPGTIKALLSDNTFTFLADGRFVGVAGGNGDKSAVVEFPSGRVIYKDLNIGLSKVSPVAHGDRILLRPIKDHPVGIFDLKQNKIVLASKRDAMDVWDEQYIAERLDGDLLVFELGTVKALEHAQLPEAPLGTIRADALSPDMNWLAVSQTSRGAVWNLQTGQRLYHVRGFSAAYFTPDGALYADFPKYLSTDRTIARAALDNPDIRPEQTIDEKKHTIEAGGYLLTVVPAKESEVYTNVTMELRDVTDQRLVWTKNFPHERPGYHVDSSANSLVLYWQANSGSAHAIAKEDPQAAASISRFKDKEGVLLVQVFDLDTGKLRAETALDTGKHSFQIMAAIATSDRLVIADNQNRVLVYSLDGQEKGTVTGHSPEVSSNSDLLTVRSERGELELYDLSNVQKRTAYDFESPVAFSGFSRDGKRLVVLTSDQVVYVLDPAAAKEGANKVAAK
jgi:WD40 repeat protein